jgi:hypothetical protein
MTPSAARTAAVFRLRFKIAPPTLEYAMETQPCAARLATGLASSLETLRWAERML